MFYILDYVFLSEGMLGDLQGSKRLILYIQLLKIQRKH